MFSMAEQDDGPIIIGSDDDFSDNDDVVFTKIEIEVDSEDVIFLSETKPPPKVESEQTKPANTETSNDAVSDKDSGHKTSCLSRSTSVTTETGRLSLDDDVKETANDNVAVREPSLFLSPTNPLDLSAKHGGLDSGNLGNNIVVTSLSDPLMKCNFQLGPLEGQNGADSSKFLSQALNPIVGGVNNADVFSVLNQNQTTSVINDATSVPKDSLLGITSPSTSSGTTLCTVSDDNKLGNSYLSLSVMQNPGLLCSDSVSFNMQQVVCKTNVQTSLPAQSSIADVKTGVNTAYPGQTTSVITHSCMAGSPVTTVSSVAGSPGTISSVAGSQVTTVSSVAGSTVSTTLQSITSSVTLASPGILTESVPRSSPSGCDPFTASHLLIASLNSQWSSNTQPRSVFHSNSCCLKAGNQSCTPGCHSQTGIYDNFLSQSTSCVGGLPGGSMTSLKNNSMKRSLSTSDKTCMYNSLTLPLSMQNPSVKHSASMSNLLGVGNSLSSPGNSDIKPTRPPYFTDTVIPLPPKKQKRCYSQEDPRKVICTNCSNLLIGEEFSQCPNGHSTCSKCLKERVKLILSGKEKESIKCLNRFCDSYYPMSELKLTLSPFVVEILEEKLDSEMIADMIMKNNGASDDNDDDYETEKETGSTSDSAVKTEKFLKKYEDMPEHWNPMEERLISKTGYQMARLEPGSPEHESVVVNFFESMVDNNVEVVHVYRVQNPILWKYYTVKKAEMTQDNEGFGCVEERQLFHGTNSSVVEAICRKGFDWRLCGKHGTMYGQGSYFAVNASYSHQYTDLRQPKKIGMSSSMMSANPFAMTLPTQPSLIYPPMNVNFGQFPAPVVMSQNSAFSVLNLSQSTPPTPSGLPPSGSYPCQSRSSMVQSSQQHNTNSTLNQGFSPAPPSVTKYTALSGAMLSQTGTKPNSNGGSNSQSGGQTVSHTVTKFRVKPKPAHIRQVSGLASAQIGTTSSIHEPQKPVAKIFLAKVLVGKYVGGDNKYRKPPPLEPKSDPFGKCYDSCVDDIRNPKIFVIFDSAQAYPEYLLEYSHI